MEDINDNVKSTYIIRRKLADLKKVRPAQTHFEYYVGNFKVCIWTDRILEHTSPDDDNIVRHALVDVNLQEAHRKDNYRLYDYVELEKDSRFKDYQPIKYKEYAGQSMLVEHKNMLKELFMNYSTKDIMQELSDMAFQTADEMSDEGFQDQAKQLTLFATSIEDLASGRPFLL